MLPAASADDRKPGGEPVKALAFGFRTIWLPS